MYFLGLGAQKAGTTTLHSWLERHPQLFLPECKEVHYFSLNYQFGWPWYEAHFHPGLDAGLRCGEITPYYLFHPAAPRRIAESLPDARLIVLLRDPVERAISHYFHARRLGFEALTLRDAIDQEQHRLSGAEAVLASPSGRHLAHQEQSYISRSDYPEQLDRYHASFADEQLLILRSEDLFEYPQACWERLLAFLELQPAPCPPLPQANRGQGERIAVADDDRAVLRRCLQPVYERIRCTYGFGWD
jgi:hypothetical protein